jgi:hypothetical protein
MNEEVISYLHEHFPEEIRAVYVKYGQKHPVLSVQTTGDLYTVYGEAFAEDFTNAVGGEAFLGNLFGAWKAKREIRKANRDNRLFNGGGGMGDMFRNLFWGISSGGLGGQNAQNANTQNSMIDSEQQRAARRTGLVVVALVLTMIVLVVYFIVNRRK